MQRDGLKRIGVSLFLMTLLALTGCGGGGSSSSATSGTTGGTTGGTSGGTTGGTTATNNPTKLIGGNIQGNALVLTGTTSLVASGLTLPGSITTDGTNIYVADAGVVQKINPSTGTVTLYYGTAGIGGACTVTLCIAKGVTTDGTNLYIVDSQGKVVQIVLATGVSSVLATGLNITSGAMTTDGSNLYIAELTGIRKI